MATILAVGWILRDQEKSNITVLIRRLISCAVNFIAKTTQSKFPEALLKVSVPNTLQNISFQQSQGKSVLAANGGSPSSIIQRLGMA